MPPRAVLREWADFKLGGQLDERLAHMKAARLTIDQMVDDLRDAGVIVSRESIRRWLRDLEAA
jgi:hypothetical protein